MKNKNNNNNMKLALLTITLLFALSLSLHYGLTKKEKAQCHYWQQNAITISPLMEEQCDTLNIKL